MNIYSFEKRINLYNQLYRMYCVKSKYRCIYFRGISMTQICCNRCDLCCKRPLWTVFFVLMEVKTDSKSKMLHSCELIISTFHLIWSNLLFEKKKINKERKHAAWKRVGGSKLLTRRWLVVCGSQTGEEDSSSNTKAKENNIFQYWLRQCRLKDHN